MPVDVLTNRYNPARTGANINEAILNQSNVNVHDFGKVFTRTVDGQIYAQPLIVTGLSFPNLGTRSAVLMATTRNMVYVFDAQEPEACHPFWAVNLDETGATPVPRSDYGGDYRDFTDEIGVTSTPVIDSSAATIFLTAKSKKKGPNGKPHYRYRLHALDLLSGADKLGGPSLIQRRSSMTRKRPGTLPILPLSPVRVSPAPATLMLAAGFHSMPSCSWSVQGCCCKTARSSPLLHRRAISVPITAGCWLSTPAI